MPACTCVLLYGSGLVRTFFDIWMGMRMNSCISLRGRNIERYKSYLNQNVTVKDSTEGEYDAMLCVPLGQNEVPVDKAYYKERGG